MADRFRLLAVVLLLLGPVSQACRNSSDGPGSPGAFLLTAPSRGTTGIAAEGYTFSWTPSFAAESYVLELSANNTFAGLLLSVPVSGTSASPLPALKPSVHYWWRVRAINAQGSTLASNAPFAFTTQGPSATVVPITGWLLQHLVFDPFRNRVYITNTWEHLLEIYDVASQSMLTPLYLYGDPMGLDITPDGSRLLVCLNGLGEIAVLDLTTDPPVVSTTLPVPVEMIGSIQADEIACDGNGRAFFTCSEYSYQGRSLVRQIDLTQASLPITVRSDIPGGSCIAPMSVAAARDRSRLIFAEWGGGFFYYNPATDTFDVQKSPANYYGSAVANADASLCSLGGTTFVEPSLRLRARIPTPQLGDNISGFCFAPTGGQAYRGIYDEPTIEIIDIARFVRAAAITIPATMRGPIATNDTGTLLFGIATGGLLVQPLLLNHPPVLEAVGTVIVNAGETVGVTIQGVDPDGDTLTWTALNLPPNASFDPATRRLSFIPSASQVGIQPTVQIVASDGVLASSAAVTLVVTTPASYPSRKIPIAGELGEIVFDPSRDRVYVANSTRNRIEVVDLLTNTRLDPIPVASEPVGLDIDADARTMVVCPRSSEYLQVLDLTAQPPVQSGLLPVPSSASLDSRFPEEVAIAANGHAIFITNFIYLGFSVLRDLDLSTSGITLRTDTPVVSCDPQGPTSHVRASGDRTRLLIGETGNSSGPLRSYASGSGLFSAPVNTSNNLYSVDVNYDGSLFLAAVGTGAGTRMFNASFSQVGSVPGASYQAAFRQGTATAFRHVGSATVSVLDPGSGSVTGTITLPDQPIGRMRTNPSGTRLVVVTMTGLVIVTLP